MKGDPGLVRGCQVSEWSNTIIVGEQQPETDEVKRGKRRNWDECGNMNQGNNYR